MAEFWETRFKHEKIMWGFEPSYSAILTKDFFLANNVKDILIPGIGYGRNAKVFSDNGIKVTGIEISKTAIDLSGEVNGSDIYIYHGSVTDIPFDDKYYDGIFCYALVHLLDKQEREKLIQNCYNQLKPNGYMIFVTVSKKANMYGMGKLLSKDRYELAQGLNMFFYDPETVNLEFKDYGLIDFIEIDEPSLKFFYVKCRKK